ncbi:SDR family oxidoreductase [Oryzobacter terrae]|uniref:SDR family oxidoreductase n=1 Tax=Oryzobacter terrae TaxID=1620385 RepID=UPI00366C0425
MIDELTGRTAVVTGGAGPLGRVLTQALADAGARVLVVDREGATEHAARLGTGHVGVTVDLTRPDAPAEVEAAVADLGACDVLVHNAAFTGTSGVPGYAVPFEEQTDEAFAAATWLNLTVPFSLTRRLAPLLREGGHGSVVMVSSIYGLVGPNMALYEGTTMGNPAAYGATKGGLVQLTRYLSTVLAPDVRVNGFAPGGIERGQDPAFVDRYSRLTPLGRMATEEDFAGVVTWLAGDASAYVTGQTVAVDGGWTAW